MPCRRISSAESLRFTRRMRRDPSGFHTDLSGKSSATYPSKDAAGGSHAMTGANTSARWGLVSQVSSAREANLLERR